MKQLQRNEKKLKNEIENGLINDFEQKKLINFNNIACDF